MAGVTTVSNLLNETPSRFLTFEAFKGKYTVKANFLQYHSVVTAVLNPKKNFFFNQTSNTEQLVGSKNFCKLAYNILIERQASLPQRNQDLKWISDFQTYVVEEIDWSKTYSLPFLCTRESKLRVFQFKLIHRRIPQTNSSTKLDSHQVSSAPSVKTRRNPFCISFGNVQKPKYSGKKPLYYKMVR